MSETGEIPSFSCSYIKKQDEMATVFKSIVMISEVALLLLLVATTSSSTGGLIMAQAQDTCSTQLSTLATCVPFVMPGASNPSADCCGALRAVPRDCICNTIRISSSLPTSCSMPPLNCAN